MSKQSIFKQIFGDYTKYEEIEIVVEGSKSAYSSVLEIIKKGREKTEGMIKTKDTIETDEDNSNQ